MRSLRMGASSRRRRLRKLCVSPTCLLLALPLTLPFVLVSCIKVTVLFVLRPRGPVGNTVVLTSWNYHRPSTKKTWRFSTSSYQKANPPNE